MVRFIAILVGLAVMFSLEGWGGLPWYYAVVFGALAYGIVRYVAYFNRERRYIRDTMEAAKRGVNCRDETWLLAMEAPGAVRYRAFSSGLGRLAF
jgi:hypothetical protein